MDEINIETMRELCCDNKVKWTLHALKRVRDRKILFESVINTILSGKIIEQYEDDKPLPSCLIFNGDYDAPLHIVACTDNTTVTIITAYVPTLDEWDNDYATRKEKK